jgi:hypothetical protein
VVFLGIDMATLVFQRVYTDLAVLYLAAHTLGTHALAGSPAQPDTTFWQKFWSNASVSPWLTNGGATVTNTTDQASQDAATALTDIIQAAGSKGFDDVAFFLGQPLPS